MTTNSVNKSTPYTPEEIRDMILGVDALVELDDDEKTKVPAINLDNAATTPAFKEVAEEVREKLLYYGSIGRGVGQKSRITTDVYVEGRDIIKKFVGLEGDIFENKNDEKYTVLHVNSTTDGMNKLASALIKSHRDMVLTTRMEHHANDLPWRERARTVYADVDEKGRLKIDDFERILGEYCAIGNGGGLIPSTCKIKYVTVTAASNVTGYVNDVHEIARIAHEYGAKIIVDGAQIVAHREFNMLGKTPEENIDFFVFSAHKMYSPFGGGVVIGLTDILNEHIPEFYGGGMVSRVADADADFSEVPDLYEAGSPNYPGVVG
ncbi:MAG: aminotransferase class V-fold PLP-dependent enzyme, partial [Chitinispirillales bacterium]|nr:aminotransferase class V-fold PLP-dependent enzyme [Chitinispirillales bacterium]